MFIHRPMHMCDIWPVTTMEPVMWQLRRHLQESNFGTVRTSPALEYACGSAAQRCTHHVRNTLMHGHTRGICRSSLQRRAHRVCTCLALASLTYRTPWDVHVLLSAVLGLFLIILCFVRRMARTSVVIITRFRAVRCVGARAGAVDFRYCVQ